MRISVLDVPEGLGWVCPAGAEAARGGAGGQLAPSTVVGMSHCAQLEEPKQARHLVDDSSGNHDFSSHQGGFSIAQGPAVGTCLSRGQAGPSWSAAGTGTTCFSDGSWSKGCECSLGAPAAAEKSPRREGPCKPSLAFWGQGTRVGEVLGCHFF